MKRRALVLIISLLVAIVGVGYWYTLLYQENFDDTRWSSRPFDNVRSIHVQGVQGTYMLTADGDTWEAQVPGASWNVVARVAPGKVADFLAKIVQLAPHRSIGGFDQGEAESFGLDIPTLKIIVTFAGKKEEPLTVKLALAESGIVYGWNSDSPGLVYEFDKKVIEQLGLSANHFLDTKVLQFDEQNVSKVQLVQPFGSSWLVEKHKEGYFFSLPGYLKDKPASDSELKLYIHSLALLSASSLILEPVVVDNKIPALTIKVWTGKEETPSTVEFYALKDAAGIYLGRSSWLTIPFTLDVQSVNLLIRSAFDVQGRTVVKLDIGTVGRFTVVNGGNEYVLERKETGWRRVGDKKDIPGIDMSLWRFTELQFEALPLNNLPDSAVKLMYCALADMQGDMMADLTFYADPKLPQGQCWMKSGSGMYYPVSSRLLKDLQGMFPVNASNGE